ncbi:MAG: hypothetical protein KatS3mg105_4726 [Gemmatales bacterium]|nr:MAG: hypothetical protein KatS3mg105_4726 [Gemmatales bacterium]
MVGICGVLFNGRRSERLSPRAVGVFWCALVRRWHACGQVCLFFLNCQLRRQQTVFSAQLPQPSEWEHRQLTVVRRENGPEGWLSGGRGSLSPSTNGDFVAPELHRFRLRPSTNGCELPELPTANDWLVTPPSTNGRSDGEDGTNQLGERWGWRSRSMGLGDALRQR